MTSWISVCTGLLTWSRLHTLALALPISQLMTSWKSGNPAMHDTCAADKSEATPVCQSVMGQPVFRREWGNRDSGMCGGIRARRSYDHARVRLLMSRPAEPCYSGLRPAGPHLDGVTPECRYGPCVSRCGSGVQVQFAGECQVCLLCGTGAPV